MGVQLAMTAAKIPSAGLIWLFGFLYILGYSCQLCQAGPDSFYYGNYAKRISPKWWGYYPVRSDPVRSLNQERRGNNYNNNWSKWWYANKRVPGSEFLGKRSSGPSVQELQQLEKRVPGSEFLGKRVPGSEFLGKRVPSSEFLGKRVPGSEFLGKRSHTMPLTQDEEEELYHVMENLTNQKPTLEVPLPYAQNTDRLRYELNESDNH